MESIPGRHYWASNAGTDMLRCFDACVAKLKKAIKTVRSGIHPLRTSFGNFQFNATSEP